MTEENQSAPTPGPWWKSIGPGLVTACVVIGPGSILTSSKVGAVDGYSKSWVVVLAVLFMFVYTSLAAKLAIVAQASTGDLVRKHAGQWLAVLIGIGVFSISAAFQFGNNLGVHSALSTYAKFDYWVILFNAISLAFVFGFRNLYQVLEKLMTCFVGLMLLSFAVNLFFAKPDLGELASGFIPSGISEIGLPLLGLVGTTFVITAAYYQSYLVRFKGWQKEDLQAGLKDSRVSATLMAMITLMLMCTAAAVLRGKELNSVSDVADSLQPFFGEKGRVIFCLGLFSAAFSSFLVNSMIGGFILSDGLKLGSTPEQNGPRILTAAVLLVGMFVALYVIKSGVRPVTAIVGAQAVTVIAAPLMAGTLLWLTNHREIMGDHRNGPAMNAAAVIGLILLILMAYHTAVNKVWPEVHAAMQNSS
ncbi:MAG TPA: divalent metal cation transporter [Verrucomicrobiales bacterium]|nr:divalent metal cation transporter [Verrucomicrobiales bacterium]